MRIWCVGDDEVVGEGENTLAVTRAMGDVSLVGFRALELASIVHVLGDGRDGEQHSRHQQSPEQKARCCVHVDSFASCEICW